MLMESESFGPTIDVKILSKREVRKKVNHNLWLLNYYMCDLRMYNLNKKISNNNRWLGYPLVYLYIIF